MVYLTIDHVIEEDATTRATSNTTEAPIEQHKIILILIDQNRRLLEIILRIEGHFGYDLKVTG